MGDVAYLYHKQGNWLNINLSAEGKLRYEKIKFTSYLFQLDVSCKYIFLQIDHLPKGWKLNLL